MSSDSEHDVFGRVEWYERLIAVIELIELLADERAEEADDNAAFDAGVIAGASVLLRGQIEPLYGGLAAYDERSLGNRLLRALKSHPATNAVDPVDRIVEG